MYNRTTTNIFYKLWHCFILFIFRSKYSKFQQNFLNTLIQGVFTFARQSFRHSSLDLFSLAAHEENAVAESRVVHDVTRKPNVFLDVTRKPNVVHDVTRKSYVVHDVTRKRKLDGADLWRKVDFGWTVGLWWNVFRERHVFNLATSVLCSRQHSHVANSSNFLITLSCDKMLKQTQNKF